MFAKDIKTGMTINARGKEYVVGNIQISPYTSHVIVTDINQTITQSFRLKESVQIIDTDNFIAAL